MTAPMTPAPTPSTSSIPSIQWTRTHKGRQFTAPCGRCLLRLKVFKSLSAHFEFYIDDTYIKSFPAPASFAQAQVQHFVNKCAQLFINDTKDQQENPNA